jgi:hypothetical protein
VRIVAAVASTWPAIMADTRSAGDPIATHWMESGSTPLRSKMILPKTSAVEPGSLMAKRRPAMSAMEATSELANITSVPLATGLAMIFTGAPFAQAL